MELIYKVKENDNYITINNLITEEFKISTRLRTKLIRNNNIHLNGTNCDTRSNLKTGDIITIDLNYEEDNSNIIPTKMDLEIIYEDEWMIVINKPAGIPIHPSLLHYNDSLSNGIKYYFDSIRLHKKIRPVNRLDLNTSGVVIFAKCEYIQECFSKQMAENLFEKIYLCIIENELEQNKGTINLPISRKKGSIIEREVNPNGQNSITHYKVLEKFQDYSFVECKLETGRTHQIRVHMSNIGHPLLGDTLYGRPSKLISRQALHSYKIKCTHPITNKTTLFIAELPKDMKFATKD